MNITKTCSKCDISKPLDEFHKDKSKKDGRKSCCGKCDNEQCSKYRKENREKIIKHKRKYYQEFGREKQGSKPMHEDKNSAQYLGVVIGERLCRHLFKDVEVMPYRHSGYDLICNKNKKIDVKTASMILSRGHHQWKFNINRNTTADFFVCIAFDNRTDLNLLYMWMIPGKEVNHRRGISIRPSTVHKWDKWKRDIEDAQLCCTEMKNLS